MSDVLKSCNTVTDVKSKDGGKPSDLFAALSVKQHIAAPKSKDKRATN